MRRASTSVISNIAEGAARNSKKEFIQFLFIAKGSLSELDAQCEIAKKLDFFSDNCYEELGNLVVSVDKMLTGLIKSLNK